MEKEKIDKVIALSHKRYVANRDYNALHEILTELEGHNYSNKGLVMGFFENMNSCCTVIRVNSEDLDNFYAQVFTAIENEWERICNKQLEIVEQADKELEEL